MSNFKVGDKVVGPIGVELMIIEIDPTRGERSIHAVVVVAPGLYDYGFWHDPAVLRLVSPA